LKSVLVTKRYFFRAKTILFLEVKSLRGFSPLGIILLYILFSYLVVVLGSICIVVGAWRSFLGCSGVGF